MNHRKIIAVDFDGTLFESPENYPGVGAPIMKIIEAVKREQAKGTLIYLYTCRGLFHPSHTQAAVDAAANHDLFFDEIIPNKPLVDEFWDDRAVNVKDIA